MYKKQVSVGDIALIPVRDFFVPAKVLYLSNYFKHVILLGIYKLKQSEKTMPSALPENFADLLYTSQEMILKKLWPRVGHEALLPGQQGLSERIVGGDIWVEDECVRPASKQDYELLRQMGVCGMGLVQEIAAEIADG
jgi:hypothetical protein